MRKALIIVDMQLMPFVWKDYGGTALYRETALLENTKKLIEKARKVDAPIYYVMHTEKGDSHRAEGKPLWQVHPEIAPNEGDHQIIKYYGDSFYETELEALLKEQGIKNIVLCGIQTEFCVDTACRSAFSHGFTAELASDCHSTFDSEVITAGQIIAHHNRTLPQFAVIRATDEIEMS